MEDRIKAELEGDQSASEVKSLNLDHARSTGSFPTILGEFTALRSLSAIGCQLTSLKGFPALANLQKLDLSENRIANGLEVLAGCPNLKSLSLANNKIKTLDVFEPLKSLTQLTSLDVEGCPLPNDAEEKVFALLPKLQYFNNVDRSGEEKPSDDEDEGDEDEDEDDENEDEEGDEEEGGFIEDDDDDDQEEGDQAEGEQESGDDDDDEYADEEKEEVGLDYLNRDLDDEPEDESDYEAGEEGEEEDDDDDDDEDDDADDEGPEQQAKRPRTE